MAAFDLRLRVACWQFRVRLDRLVALEPEADDPPPPPMPYLEPVEDPWPVVIDEDSEEYEPIARDREAERARAARRPGYLEARAEARRRLGFR